MNRRSDVLAALRSGFIWSVAGSLPAQVYIVDANGGPGTNFTSIAAAIPAVPSGAVLDVRPGTYGPFAISAKSVAVLGRPGAKVFDLAPALVTVSNLSATQSVTLSGLDFAAGLASGWLRFQANQGEIVLQRLTTAGSASGAGLIVDQTDRLHVVECNLHSASAASLSMTSSRAFVTDTTMSVATPTASAIQLIDSVLDLTRSQVSAYGVFGAAALNLYDATSLARVRGSSVLGNTPGAATAPAVIGVGTLRLAPTVQILSSGAPAIASTVNTTVVAMPSVTASVPTIGTTATASLALPPLAVGGLWTGSPGALVVMPPFVEPLAIDANGAIAVVATTVSPFTVNYPVPNLPALQGVRLAWQGCSFDPVAGFQASNVVVVCAR